MKISSENARLTWYYEMTDTVLSGLALGIKARQDAC